MRQPGRLCFPQRIGIGNDSFSFHFSQLDIFLIWETTKQRHNTHLIDYWWDFYIPFFPFSHFSSFLPLCSFSNLQQTLMCVSFWVSTESSSCSWQKLTTGKMMVMIMTMTMIIYQLHLMVVSHFTKRAHTLGFLHVSPSKRIERQWNSIAFCSCPGTFWM